MANVLPLGHIPNPLKLCFCGLFLEVSRRESREKSRDTYSMSGEKGDLGEGGWTGDSHLLFGFRVTTSKLGTYSGICAEESLRVEFRGLYEMPVMEAGSPTCKQAPCPLFYYSGSIFEHFKGGVAGCLIESHWLEGESCGREKGGTSWEDGEKTRCESRSGRNSLVT